MSVDKEIHRYLQDLPPEDQDEVLDFVKFLSQKNQKHSWGDLSLESAMRGLEQEDETNYTKEDIKEST